LIPLCLFGRLSDCLFAWPGNPNSAHASFLERNNDLFGSFLAHIDRAASICGELKRAFSWQCLTLKGAQL
jgi:hypothetical protein